MAERDKLPRQMVRASACLQPTTVGSSLPKNASNWLRLSWRRTTTFSSASTPCSWKNCFDVSVKMRVIFSTDGSLD